MGFRLPGGAGGWGQGWMGGGGVGGEQCSCRRGLQSVPPQHQVEMRGETIKLRAKELILLS